MSSSRLITDKISQSKSSSSWLSSVCRSVCLRGLKHIQKGQLVVIEGDQRFVFGNDDSLKANVIVRDPRFYSRLLSSGSVGAGEAFIEEWWDSDNVTDVIQVVAANLPMIDRIESFSRWFSKPVNWLKSNFIWNTRKRSKDNIVAHYDLGNELYSRFLDETMLYSAAMFPREEASLYEASVHKLQVICKKLDLKPGDKVLEIGTGWGALAICMAKDYQCQVTTTTLSDEQFEYTQALIEEQGLQEQITLLKTDYRDLTGKFDKIVSIEMIEAVGHELLDHYFKQCNQLLRPNGKLLIQSILIDDNRYQSYKEGCDFIQKYIFPGGALPSDQVIREKISHESELSLDGVEHFGRDYARTLTLWRNNFNKHWQDIKPFGYDQRFYRLWNFYFHYCEGGFLQNTISVAHFQVSKSSE
ncbi:cyclopropane-fatty-acyl-phospholipid synthase family protein [Pleionea sp. CnH1-48]|uniref:SAM-dependent methyltransferase n=1 Tax=Pleionea sp. CnH1-48 TaxID=2954494 RepID=UPI00209685CD|nr:cyclopropane-fatty-acyl-phospholipid synthase family protein [Pleionea sp. CnH1-48]MCO7226918.1 cyclopropane-fatty-acyl-phospholipid synthase family protein [Pleionea sp. CnH1-48]